MDFINEKEGDLDALINAHRVYLDRMVKKLLLIGPKAGKEVGCFSEFQCLTLTSMISGEPAQSGQGGILADSRVLRRDSESQTCAYCPKVDRFLPQEHFYNLYMTESSRRDSERDQTRVSSQTPLHYLA
jgi:hypothetical protein